MELTLFKLRWMGLFLHTAYQGDTVAEFNTTITTTCNTKYHAGLSLVCKPLQCHPVQSYPSKEADAVSRPKQMARED